MIFYHIKLSLIWSKFFDSHINQWNNSLIPIHKTYYFQLFIDIQNTTNRLYIDLKTI